MTSNSAPKPIPVLVSASEIAEIAAVGPSAVSNWKRRHRDFPGEVEEGLYDRSEVVAWLRDSGKEVNLLVEEPLEAALWRWASELRGALRIDEIPEVLLQLFTLRAAASGDHRRLTRLASFWDEHRSSVGDNLSEVQHAINRAVGESDPDLARAMRITPSIHRLQTSDWHDLVDQLDPARTDWGWSCPVLLDTGF